MSPTFWARALFLALAQGAAAGAASLEEPIQPLPMTLKADAARAAIGQRLFNDPSLSANGKVSCASCHLSARGGADPQARSIGFKGRPTAVNAPTVLNAALNFKQFWNGRADSLETQVHAIVSFANRIGTSVIVQGVETEEQRMLLASADTAPKAQGFHFSKAVEASRAEELLRQCRVEPQIPATTDVPNASTA